MFYFDPHHYLIVAQLTASLSLDHFIQEQNLLSFQHLDS